MSTVKVDEEAWSMVLKPGNPRFFQRQIRQLSAPIHEEISTYHLPRAMRFFKTIQEDDRVVSLRRPLVTYENCMTALSALARFYKAAASGVVILEQENYWMWVRKDLSSIQTTPVISESALATILGVTPLDLHALLAPFMADGMVKKVRRDMTASGTREAVLDKTDLVAHRGYRIDPNIILSLSGALNGAPQFIRERPCKATTAREQATG